MPQSRGERIRRLRKSLGLTQKKLAAAIGVQTAFVSLMEAGRSGPSTETLFRLAKALSTTVQYIELGEIGPGSTAADLDSAEGGKPLPQYLVPRILEILHTEHAYSAERSVPIESLAARAGTTVAAVLLAVDGLSSRDFMLLSFDQPAFALETVHAAAAFRTRLFLANKAAVENFAGFLLEQAEQLRGLAGDYKAHAASMSSRLDLSSLETVNV